MQSRLMSLVETSANIAVGYLMAVLTQILVFPLFGLHATLGENLLIGGLFTVVSFVRGYVLRRLFNTMALRPDPTVALSRNNSPRGGFAVAKPEDHV